MRQHPKAILGVAIFYTVVVAILDFFLKKIPIINWLALGLAFIFFTALILDSVVKLLARRPPKQAVLLETTEDELDRLEKTIDRALIQHQPESLRVLDERLKAVFLSAYAQTNQSVIKVPQLSHEEPKPLTARNEESQNTEAAAKRWRLIRNGSSNEVRTMLTEIEKWLT